MFHTKNTMPEKTRIAISSLLQERLADSIDLAMQAKQAHWNVRGTSFIALHELFDKVSSQFGEYSDLIAERIVQLGGIAEGTIRMAGARSTLPEYPKTLTHEKEHVASLSHALAIFGENTKNAMSKSDELNDADTTDILTEVSRGTDKYLWFVEAHYPEQTPKR